MTKPGRTIFVFGLYLMFLGASLVFVPNTILNVFRAPTTDEVWIRVLGVLIALIGYMYVQSARRNIEGIYIITVHARSSVLFALGAFVILDMAPPSLVLFGIVDMLGAMWTYRTIKGSRKELPPSQTL